MSAKKKLTDSLPLADAVEHIHKQLQSQHEILARIDGVLNRFNHRIIELETLVSHVVTLERHLESMTPGETDFGLVKLAMNHEERLRKMEQYTRDECCTAILHERIRDQDKHISILSRRLAIIEHGLPPGWMLGAMVSAPILPKESDDTK